MNGEIDHKLKQAGVDGLNKFGILNTLDMLAIRYHTHPDIVKEWKYGYCFNLLFKINTERFIEKNYNEIIKAESKIKK